MESEYIVGLTSECIGFVKNPPNPMLRILSNPDEYLKNSIGQNFKSFQYFLGSSKNLETLNFSLAKNAVLAPNSQNEKSW